MAQLQPGLKYFLGAVLLCVSLGSYAQQYQARKAYSLRFGYFPGEIIKHSDNITTLESFAANSFVFDASFQADTGVSWGPPQGYPHLGLSVVFSDYAASSVGTSLAVMPFVENRHVLFGSRFSFRYHLGWGLGYGSKVYDPVENPENRSLSTHLNVAFDMRSGFSYSLRPDLRLSVDAGLLHLSNAAVQMPNYGINLFHVGAALAYEFGGDVYLGERESALLSPEWAVVLSAGSRQADTILGRYAVQSLHVEYNFLNGKAHRGGVGIAIMNDAVRKEYYEWAERWGDGTHRRFNFFEMLNVGLFVNYEKVFSRFSAFLQAGGYLLHPYRQLHTTTDYGSGPYYHYTTLTRSYIFNKVGVRYRFPRHIMLNVGLKTHLFQAQFLEFGIGTYF